MMTDRNYYEVEVRYSKKLEATIAELRAEVAEWKQRAATAEAEVKRLRSVLLGAEIALARDENIDAAMKCLLKEGQEGVKD